MITQFTVYKQSAVQNKISQATCSFEKFGKISTSGRNPLYGILLDGFDINLKGGKIIARFIITTVGIHRDQIKTSIGLVLFLLDTVREM